jgi:predicted HicB family RNase H-like nuclease
MLTEQFLIRLPEKEASAVRDAAAKANMSITAWFIKVIDEATAKTNKKTEAKSG